MLGGDSTCNRGYSDWRVPSRFFLSVPFCSCVLRTETYRLGGAVHLVSRPHSVLQFCLTCFHSYGLAFRFWGLCTLASGFWGLFGDVLSLRALCIRVLGAIFVHLCCRRLTGHTGTS